MSQELINRQNQLKPALVQARKQISSLLEDETKANKFLAASLVVASNKNLMKCSPESITQCLVGVAMTNLSIDPNFGHCYLVPYKGSVQLQIGYKGYIQLLRRAGFIIEAHSIFKQDDYSRTFVDGKMQVEIDFNDEGKELGSNDWVVDNMVGVYVTAKEVDTGYQHGKYVSISEIERLRKISPSQRVGQYTKPVDKDKLAKGLPIGIWGEWYESMCHAKAIKKMAKTLPIGDELARAIAIDDKQDIGQPVDFKQTAESDTGLIIEMDHSVTDKKLNDFILKVEECTTIDQLNELGEDVSSFSGNDKMTAKDSWLVKETGLKEQGDN